MYCRVSAIYFWERERGETTRHNNHRGRRRCTPSPDKKKNDCRAMCRCKHIQRKDRAGINTLTGYALVTRLKHKHSHGGRPFMVEVLLVSTFLLQRDKCMMLQPFCMLTRSPLQAPTLSFNAAGTYCNHMSEVQSYVWTLKSCVCVCAESGCEMMPVVEVKHAAGFTKTEQKVYTCERYHSFTFGV